MMRARRNLLTAGAASMLLPGAAVAQRAKGKVEIEERALADLAADIAARRTTSQQLVAAYTARIRLEFGLGSGRGGEPVRGGGRD